jgi:Ca-activated chloride channel family protein
MHYDWLIPFNSRTTITGALSLVVLSALTAACSTADTSQESGTGATLSGGSDSQGTAATGPGSGSATDAGGTGGWDPSAGSDGSGAATTTAGGTSGYGDETGGEEPPPDDEDSNSSSGAESTGGEEMVCDSETPVVLYLSPDDSNSTASPVLVREAVLGGFGSLAYAPIRTWEFLNYYSFNYEAAEPGMVTVTPELARIEGGPDNQMVVQIGVASETIANPDRPLMNITMVLDESGSMGGHPIEMERAVCRAIAGSLRAGDVVSMVGWDTSNAVKLSGHQATGPNDATIVQLCDGLEAGGGTDLNGGLTAGYELAHEHFDAKRINRVVLVSDGGANAGVADIDIIAGGAGSQDQDGIYLVGVGVGTPEWYNDELMDTVTDVGRGASLFVGSAAEAKKMFTDRFVATMQVAARDVRVRLDLPPGFEVVKFSGEQISSNPEEVEPQHLAPNDAMVFHQTLATCAPQLIDEEAKFEVTVRFRDAVTFEQREVIESRRFVDAINAQSPLLLKGSAVFEYATALKAWRDGTDHAAALAPAFAALAAAEAALPGDPDLAEIRTVLAAVQAMG